AWSSQNYDPRQMISPGWPWWTLTFAPYLILTVTSELWPSRQDWHGARWLLAGLVVVAGLLGVLLWVDGVLVFNENLLQSISHFSTEINFVFLLLLGLDLVFLLIAEVIVRVVRY
ncbi:MAG TPA: hypothetical protein VKV19_01145, partial [Ktedonobacteraceae bacterium]|nr:hypothetical protein [Ktedonobacteraceae bacterium]